MDFFLESNGSAGRVSYASAEFQGLRRWVRLYDWPRHRAAALISRIGAEAKRKGEKIQMIHHWIDALPQGIIVGNQGLLAMSFSGVDGVTSGELLNRREYDAAMEKSHNLFIQAKKIHDEWEQIYIRATDFQKLNRLADEMNQQLFADHYLPKAGKRKDRFFGSGTAAGAKDYVETITEGLPQRYFIKGRPGTGKSTFLRKIAEYALSRGFDTEIYHCSFDPSSLDMVVVRERGLCIFDSTAPHEYEPERAGDERLDFYRLAVDPDTDQTYAAALQECAVGYREKIQEATQWLRLAKNSLEETDQRLDELLDQEKINRYGNEIMKEMLN